MMHDAHFHTDEYAFLDFLAQQLIQGIVNASSPQEYLRLRTVTEFHGKKCE